MIEIPQTILEAFEKGEETQYITNSWDIGSRAGQWNGFETVKAAGFMLLIERSTTNRSGSPSTKRTILQSEEW